MGFDAGAGRRALASFAPLSLPTRAFLLARMAVAPLGPLDARLRSLNGRVLSLGCGHGVVDRYIAEINPDVTIEGVDLDEGRVAQARATEHLAPRVRVEVADVTTLDPGDGYDAALAIDVLHHVPFETHATIAAALLRALRPGGTCLVKDMAPEPRRQYLWNRTHDRIVAGPDPIHCRMPEDMAAVLGDAGFVIEDVRRLRRLGIYPQYVVEARKPVSVALVTGGTGFLGSHLSEALRDAGYEVRVLDVIPPPQPLGEGLLYIRADVRDREAMMRAADGAAVVVDNAALVPVTKSSAEGFRSVNVEGCRVTLEAARAAGAYVVHVSSSSIYGMPDAMPVTEETPLAPFEPYGASKAEAERLVHAERAAGLPVASLRSRALLGRGRLGLFELVFSRIRAGRRVPMFGRGDNVLQMCDARDFASAALACIERRADGDYNIGAAEFGTPREDLEALIGRVGSAARLQPVPVWAIRAVLQPLALVGRSPFTAWHWHASAATFHASIDKARRELGWEPQHSNVDALERAYHEFLGGTAGGSAHSAPLAGALARVLRG